MLSPSNHQQTPQETYKALQQRHSPAEPAMDVEEVQNEQLRCKICGKNSTNSKPSTCSASIKKSLTRHMHYCNKSRYRERSRKKSCLSCTKAKARCDLAYPSCSRCTTKDFACAYEKPRLPKTSTAELSVVPVSGSVKTALASSQSPDESIADLQSIQSTPSDTTGSFALPFHTSQSPAPLPPSTISSDWSSWDFEDTFPTSPYVRNAPLRIGTHCSRSLPFAKDYTPLITMDYRYQTYGITNFKLYDPIIAKAPRSFRPRTAEDYQSSLKKRYLLCTFHSYPSMLLSGKALPPFIHPLPSANNLPGGQTTNKSLPRPLAACAAIMQMYSVKNENNVAFIWRAIRMEQERFSVEALQYDDETAVAALQAMAIYLILRLSEKDEEATNFDVPLVYTMMSLSLQAIQKIVKHGTPSGHGPTWRDWILAESLNRTTILVFIINKFFDLFEMLPYENCDARWLHGMPLPCGRDIWRATTSAEWEREYLARGASKIDGKELIYSDLLNSTPWAEHLLDSWLSQLDDFGTVVMAAASLTD